ncbi:MAG: iron chelate uptake ABC transporter family permease subunit, partial [Actinomycetaceae bacterium]
MALVVAAAGGVLQLLTGSPDLDLKEVAHVLVGGESSTAARTSVVDLRVPRLLLALLAGAALGLAGALLQDALGNSLGSPDLLGVSAAAALVVAIVGVLHLPVGGAEL